MANWLITGCSSGLGRAISTAVLDTGHCAVLTSRNADDIADLVTAHPDRALVLSLDVTDTVRVGEVVAAGVERFGHLDVLVNNAGYGYRSAVEEGAVDDVAALFATNFFGPIELIKAVLPGMRERRSGAIVNISSIAAQMRPAGSGYYAASKAALEAMSGALRKEVGPLGIAVLSVEPGAFRTDFAGRSLQQSPAPVGDYAETAGKRRKDNDREHGHQPGDPAKLAQALLTVLDSPAVPELLVLGPDAYEREGLALDVHRTEREAWRDLSLGTDFD